MGGLTNDRRGGNSQWIATCVSPTHVRNGNIAYMSPRMIIRTGCAQCGVHRVAFTPNVFAENCNSVAKIGSVFGNRKLCQNGDQKRFRVLEPDLVPFSEPDLVPEFRTENRT